MDKIKPFFEWLEDYGISIWLLIAGFFGSLLSLKDKKGLTRWAKLTSISSGILVANYLTPLIFEYLKVNEGAKYGIGFVFGYIGLEAVQWITLIFKKKIKGHE